MLTYLPHGNKVVSEEVKVDLPWHLARLLHVDVVVEEVLKGWHLPKRLQLVTIVHLFLLARLAPLRLGLWTNLGYTFDSLLLLLRVKWSLSLVVPELP